MPDLAVRPLDLSKPETLSWLGRLATLVHGYGDPIDSAGLRVAIDSLPTMRQEHSVNKIMVILYRTLAKAEMNAPVSARGSFVPAANSFDALAAISKILSSAEKSVRIIDPYLDEKILTVYAAMAVEGVLVELLADSASVKASLKPAVDAWIQQYGANRPLEARVAAAKLLHDRLIIVDEETVWDLSQSVKDFAARSPASISKAEAELAALKIASYDAIWQDAAAL